LQIIHGSNLRDARKRLRGEPTEGLVPVTLEINVGSRFKKFFTFSALAGFAAVVSFISDFGGAWDNVIKLFGHDEPLVVMRARLSPFARDPRIKQGRDEASLSLEVRNYGKETVMLTSAELEVVHGKGAKVGQGGVFGKCSLTAVDNENVPMTVGSGQSRWLVVSRSVDLPGVSSFLTGEKLLPVFVHSVGGQPFSIAQSIYVDELNTFFSDSYGSEAALKVTLHSTPSGEKHVFVLPLARGKDLFAKDGSLQHDWFIANWKNWDKNQSIRAPSCEAIVNQDW